MHDDELFEVEPVEGYCVRCRQSVELEDPMPVWTRKGMPATRGECPNCGGTVFRMGKTDAHDGDNRPTAIQVGPTSRRLKLTPDTVYVNFATPDEEIAQQLADDLQRIGFAVWLHDPLPEDVNWAGGVHPALKECARMVLVLSPHSLIESTVEDAWKFFRSKGKPIILAQVAPAEPPDAVRRSPRFDFTADYRTNFRQMVQNLS